MRNNINVAGISEYVNEIKENPNEAMASFGVELDWVSGTKNKVSTKPLMIGDHKLVRTFEFNVDEPAQLLGINQFANPAEYLMGAVAACMSVTFTAGATMMGITLEKLSIEMRGGMNLKGFLGMDEDTYAGVEEISCEIHVKGNGTKEQYEILKDRVKKHSPNFNTIVNGVRMEPKLVVEE